MMHICKKSEVCEINRAVVSGRWRYTWCDQVIGGAREDSGEGLGKWQDDIPEATGVGQIKGIWRKVALWCEPAAGKGSASVALANYIGYIQAELKWGVFCCHPLLICNCKIMEIVAMVCLLNRRIQRLAKLMYQRVLLSVQGGD
jgi:hypothetical protein